MSNNNSGCNALKTWAKQTTQNIFNFESTDEFHYINQNKKILDFSSTSFQASFGLKNDFLTSAFQEQIKKFPIASPKGQFNLKKTTTDQLISYLNQDEKGKIFWTTSGSESIENALKIARDLRGVQTVVSRKKSYHGATLGSISISGDWRNQAIKTVDDWTLRIPDPDEDPKGEKTKEIIENFGPNNIAAICIEPISGANGVIIPSKEWVQEINNICKKYSIFLIADEVVCGFHRTGNNLGSTTINLNPDFICLAKSITGGFFPFGAIWMKEAIAKNYDNKVLPCGLTNYAHPIGLQITNKVLQYLSKINTIKSEAFFQSQLEGLKSLKNVKVIRSIGFLAAIELNNEVTWNKLYKNGLYAISNGKQVIIAPAINMPEDLIKHGVLILRDVLNYD